MLIEDIPLCFNDTKSETKYLRLPSKHNNSIKILVFYCGNKFQSYYTIFRPTVRDMRYNQCISCAVGSHITYRVYIKIVQNHKKLYIYIKVAKKHVIVLNYIGQDGNILYINYSHIGVLII